MKAVIQLLSQLISETDPQLMYSIKKASQIDMAKFSLTCSQNTLPGNKMH